MNEREMLVCALVLLLASSRDAQEEDAMVRMPRKAVPIILFCSPVIGIFILEVPQTDGDEVAERLADAGDAEVAGAAEIVRWPVKR